MKNYWLVWCFCLVMVSCRSTKAEDERYFAPQKTSKNSVAITDSHIIESSPAEPLPGPLPPLVPQSDINDGPFFLLCSARNLLPIDQKLSIESILKATHQLECVAAEKFLRQADVNRLILDSIGLRELNTLSVLKNYSQIKDIWIKVAPGLHEICPLPATQTCHFTIDELAPASIIEN